MKVDSQPPDRGAAKTDAGRHLRPSLWVGIAAVAASCATTALFAHFHSERIAKPGVVVDAASTERAAEQPSADPPQVAQNKMANEVVSAPAVTTASAALPEVHPDPTPETRQLVNALVRLEPENGVLTEKLAMAWKQDLQTLTQQGPNAIPAMQEFLARNVDVVFGDAGKQMLGYSSARLAMFDALSQIGGPEGVAAMTAVLQTTAEPMEVAILAQALEKLEPQRHQVEVLNATRQALEIASGHKLEPTDAAPLFEVLQKYGGSAAVTELEKATGQWNYYGTIALAELPDGAGIPSLVQIAQDPKVVNTLRDAAFQMLAKVSSQSPEARAALVEQARLNSISDFAWRILTPVLAGDKVGFVNSAFDHQQGLPQVGGLRTTGTSDNQSFYTMPATLTQDQLNQHLALIDDLLSATTNPTAKELLEQQRISLSRRAAAIVASGP